MGDVIGDLTRHRHGEARLADAAGAGQGQQPDAVAPKQAGRRRRFPVPAEERGGLGGQPCRPAVGRARRREHDRGGDAPLHEVCHARANVWRTTPGHLARRTLRRSARSGVPSSTTSVRVEAPAHPPHRGSDRGWSAEPDSRSFSRPPATTAPGAEPTRLMSSRGEATPRVPPVVPPGDRGGPTRSGASTEPGRSGAPSHDFGSEGTAAGCAPNRQHPYPPAASSPAPRHRLTTDRPRSGRCPRRGPLTGNAPPAVGGARRPPERSTSRAVTVSPAGFRRRGWSAPGAGRCRGPGRRGGSHPVCRARRVSRARSVPRRADAQEAWEGPGGVAVAATRSAARTSRPNRRRRRTGSGLSCPVLSRPVPSCPRWDAASG